MPLTDDQVALLQAFIDDKPAGIYDAWDLIPDEYRKYFASPTAHGEAFKRAVDGNLFKSVAWVGVGKNSKHQRYSLHGAAVPDDEKLLR